MLSSLLVAQALAQDAAPPPEAKSAFKPEFKTTALVYLGWGMDLDPAAEGANAFSVDRAYLGAGAKLSEKIAARVLLDADVMSATTDTKQRVFVKNAYAEWYDFAPGMKARAGIVDTGYPSYSESFTGFRYLGKVFADRNKVLNTADFGINVQGKNLDGLLDWHAALLNGEGYGKPEVDAGKTGQLRVAVDPLAKGKSMSLPIMGFASYALPGAATPDATLVYVGSAGFKMPYVMAWGEYLGVSEGTKSGGGFSAQLSPRAPNIAYLVARYDHFDPDSAATGDGTDLLVAGVGRDFMDKVSVALTYEQTTLESAPTKPASGIFVHAQAGW
jgi:hypothetical protein